MTKGQKVLLVLFVLVVGAAAILLGACSKQDQPDIPSIYPVACATWQVPDGTWMEEDNEPVDDDPCDRLPDVKKSSKAPVPVKTTKPASKPSPAKTRR